MRLNYAKEKLGSAVQSMATDKAPIQKRLWHAYLIFHTLSEKDFSEDLKEDWNFIYSNLTTAEPSYDSNNQVTFGRVENTLRTIDENTCVKIAERIVNLESKLRHL